MVSETSGNIDRPDAMPVFTSIWQSGAAFLQRCGDAQDGPASWIQRVSDDDLALATAPEGTILAVSIRFLDSDMTFNIHAVVVSPATGGWAKLAFLEDERPRQDMVLACAEGQPFPYLRRRHPRLVCRLPARVRVDQEEPLDAVATDISAGGVRLSIQPALRQGSHISLWITLPRTAERLAATGRVAYAQGSASTTAVGVEFEFTSRREADAVASAVESLREP